MYEDEHTISEERLISIDLELVSIRERLNSIPFGVVPQMLLATNILLSLILWRVW